MIGVWTGKLPLSSRFSTTGSALRTKSSAMWRFQRPPVTVLRSGLVCFARHNADPFPSIVGCGFPLQLKACQLLQQHGQEFPLGHRKRDGKNRGVLRIGDYELKVNSRQERHSTFRSPLKMFCFLCVVAACCCGWQFLAAAFFSVAVYFYFYFFVIRLLSRSVC